MSLVSCQGPKPPPQIVDLPKPGNPMGKRSVAAEGYLAAVKVAEDARHAAIEANKGREFDLHLALGKIHQGAPVLETDARPTTTEPLREALVKVRSDLVGRTVPKECAHLSELYLEYLDDWAEALDVLGAAELSPGREDLAGRAGDMDDRLRRLEFDTGVEARTVAVVWGLSPVSVGK